MKRYAFRQIALTVPVLFGVTLAVFAILHLLPVDPVQFMLTHSTSGTSPSVEVTEATKANLRHELGLDRPVYIQYATFALGAAQGDLGKSFRNNRPVSELILEQMPYTLQLAVAAFLLSVVFGLLLGILAGRRPRSIIDRGVMVGATVGVSVPTFWFGLMLIYFLAFQLRLLPALGTGSLNGLIMPAVALALPGAAVIARITRSNLVEQLQQEYITTARSKGLSNSRVLIRHALRNALVPILTVVGLLVGDLLTGAVVIETVFGRPGVGRLGVQAILEADYPLVQGFVLVIAVIYVFTNLVVDLVCAWLDPRIRV